MVIVQQGVMAQILWTLERRAPFKERRAADRKQVFVHEPVDAQITGPGARAKTNADVEVAPHEIDAIVRGGQLHVDVGVALGKPGQPGDQPGAGKGRLNGHRQDPFVVTGANPFRAVFDSVEGVLQSGQQRLPCLAEGKGAPAPAK